MRVLLTSLFLLPLLLTAAAPPNIVFIMADDMGYHDAGAYGGKEIATPNIDRLARDGVRFTQVYAGHPVCAPSRNVLMTGTHSGHNTVRDNFSKTGGVTGLGGGEGRVPLRAEDLTVAEVLKQAGYVTGMTGKWGLGEPNTTGEPNRQGFDEWFGYLNQRLAHSYYPDFLWLNKGRFDLTGNMNGERSQYSHDLISGFALNFLRRHARERFFLYVPYTIPHSEFEVPDLGQYENKPWSEEKKAVAAMETRMDKDIGRILDLLDELGVADNTVVFFCSDNGAAGAIDEMFNGTGKFRAFKGSVYEGGIRTPMIVRWPGRIKAGSVNETAVWYFADFMPTAAELAGVKVPENLDGVSVLPTLLGKKQDLSKRFLYWESHSNGFHQAARRGDWKAVRHGIGEPVELYNLARDVSETTDVSAANPKIVAEFTEYFRTGRTDSPHNPLP